MDFSEAIAASDLKVGRYRQLIELMNIICEYSRSRSFLEPRTPERESGVRDLPPPCCVLE